ncbi:MAG: NAD(P)-binding domain-containing protein, partial [Bdellovibrionota bacterium]
ADGFVLELAGGSSLSCRHVILATGHMPFRSLPAELGSLTEKVCQHTAQIRDVRKYSGKDVTVIGAGQSALETAALVSEAGAKVRLVVRKNQIKWNAPSTKVGRPLLARIRKPEAGLGGGWAVLAISELPQAYRAFSAEKRHRFFATSWGPSGSRWLRARVENRIEALTGHRIRSAAEEGGRVRLTLEGPDGAKELVTDHVIAGTGFKIGLERLTYLDPELRKQIALENLAPALSSRFETSVPGLFIVGIATAPTFGPVMRFMFGGKHAAPAITKRLRAARRFWRATRAD